MANIDLVECVNKSLKISSKYLEKDPLPEKQELKTWKILAAYGIDFYTILMLTGLITTLLDLGFNSFMITNSLQKAQDRAGMGLAILCLLPIVVMSYYFFSYFFNHGQTLGKYLLKNRIQMPGMSFSASFAWALYSSSMIFTCGLVLLKGKAWPEQRGLGNFEVHDHLYHELIRTKTWSPVVLVDEISNYTTQETAPLTYDEAA